MRKNRFKKWLFSLFIVVFTLGVKKTVFAGQWFLDTAGWKYDSGNGIYLTNCWEWIDGNQDGEAECYYFDASGYCLINAFAPDGSIVDEQGAWILNGVVQKKYVGGNVSENSRVIYKSILEQYKAAINHHFYKDVLRYSFDIQKEIGTDVNEYLLQAAGYSDSSEVYYAFADIDRNGTEELLIGLSGNGGELWPPQCFDVFGYNGSRPVHLFDFDNKFTERTFFTLYANGIMEIEGSGGAAFLSTGFYRMEPNGCHAELIEEVTYEGSYDPFGKDKYFHYVKDMQNTEEISETKYWQICKKYEIMNKYDLSWMKLSGDEVF